MSETIDNLRSRFDELSPIMRFGVVCLALILLFLIWDATIRPISQEWSAKADAVQQDVRKLQDSDLLDDRLRRVSRTIVALGEVELPGDKQRGSAAFNEIISNMLGSYRSRISDDSFTLGQGGRLPKDTLSTVIGEGRQAELLTGDLQFISSPETAAEIIAELEASPDIEAIKNVRLLRDGNKKVKVILKVEAWVAARKNRRSA